MKKIITLLLILTFLFVMGCQKESERCTFCTDSNGNKEDSICGTEAHINSFCESRGWRAAL